MINVDRDGVPTLVQGLEVGAGLCVTFHDFKGIKHKLPLAHQRRTLVVYKRNLAEGLVNAVDTDVIETAWHEAEAYLRWRAAGSLEYI